MSMPYIVQKISDNNIGTITTPEDYFVVAQSNTRTVSFEGNQFIAEGDENLFYPIVEIRENIEIDPPANIIYVVENILKLESYNQMQSEQ